jgi:hypothetical protein
MKYLRLARRNNVALIGMGLIAGSLFKVVVTLLMRLPFDPRLTTINTDVMLVGIVMLTAGVWQESGRGKEL